MQCIRHAPRTVRRKVAATGVSLVVACLASLPPTRPRVAMARSVTIRSGSTSGTPALRVVGQPSTAHRGVGFVVIPETRGGHRRTLVPARSGAYASVVRALRARPASAAMEVMP
jgi:hypothetical protein